MKTKIKRHYRSAVSVLLSICMLISCMAVGLVGTDAALVTGGSEAVGARVEEDEAVGDSLSLQTLNFFFENPKSSDGRSATLRVLSAAQNQEYELTISSESNYFVEIEVGGTKGSGGERWLSLYPSLNKNGDYFSDTSKWAESWSDGQSSATKFAPGKYIFKWTEWQDQTTDNDYKAKVNFSLKKAPDEHTVQIASSDNYVGTVTGTNSSGAVTIAEGESDKKLTQGSEATISVEVSNGQKADYATVTGISNVPLTYTGSGTTYTGTFTVPNQSSITVTPHLRDKNTYSVVAANTDGLGTVYPGTPQTYTEDSPVTLTAVPTGNNYFKKWQGTVYSSSDNPATYYVNGADADGSTITITGNFGTNHYTASAGTSLAPANIYAGINATFFDYYYDNEVTNGWLHFSGENNDINPYKTFNTALSEYAKGNGVKIPLYFGNFYWPKDNNDSGFSAGNGNFLNYTNWFGPPNNVDRLRRDTTHYSSAVGGITDPATHYAITGLTGTKLSDDHQTIYHFDNTATNNTGVPMALFDEEWLTHRDKYTDGAVEKDYSYKGALATIIDSPFPVVKQEYYRLYFTKLNGWDNVRAYFYKNGNPTYGAWPGKTMSCLSGDLYYLDIPKADINSVKGATVIFSASNNDRANRKEVTVPSGTDTKDWYNDSAWSNKGDFTKTIDYYGFNSTNATDNAYFDGLNGGSPTNLTMEYGAGTTYGVHDNQKSGNNFTKYGCFPFDGNIKNTNTQAKDYGFGVRMDIPFTLGQGGKINGVNQIFEFSGDDDLWVFIDGELVLDLGGAHGATTGYIDFGHGTDQAKVVANTAVENVQYPGGDIPAVERNHTSNSGVFSFTNTGADVEITKHTMTLYYMERGMGESNLKFGFSFTPVSNEFMTEKKLGTDNVNSALKSDVETAVAGDKFNFTNEWSASTSNKDFSKLASGKKYTLIHNGAKSNETTADNNGILPHQNEWFSFGDQTEFIGQFTVGHYFKLEETAKIGNSAYTYTPSLEVKDLVTGSTIAAESNGAYLFKTTKATTDPTHYDADTDPTRIKATYTNSVLTKSVTITKAVAETDVDNPDFTVKVRVQLPGGSKKAYQLVSTSGTLNPDGTFTFKAGGSNTISGIPVGATVEVTEVSLPQDYSMTGWTVTCTGATTLNTDTSAHKFVIPSDGADTVTVALTNTKATGKNVKIYKTLTSGTSEQTYTMFIKTVSALDDTSPADYSGTYTVKNVSDDTTVGTANQTYTSAGVSITTAQYILLENVSTSTKLEVTEKVLSSAYVRAFHYAYTKVGIGSAEQTQITATSDADPIAVDNGVRFSVTDNTVVNVYNKPWTYYIKYNYPAYLARYYGITPPQQFYVKSGAFTDADFDETTGLLTIDSINDSNGTPRPCPVFKDKTNTYAAIKDGLSNFITTKAPYEDNFMSTLTWNPIFATSGSNVQNTTFSYKPLSENANVEIKTNADERPNKTVYAYFRLPYDHQSWDKDGGKRLDPMATDGKVLKKDWVNYRVETQYGTWVTLNDATTKSEAQWVEAAPEIYGSDGKTYVFDYWQMTSIGYNENFVDVDEHTKPERLHELKLEIPYKRCYNLAFNMTMYQDSYVEAVYVEKGDPRANMTQQQKEAADRDQVSNGAVINFLENSRNQWNNNGGTLYGESYENIASRIAKGDRVFSDFLLSFHMDNDITLAGDLSNTVKEQAKDEQGNLVFDDEGNEVMVDVSYPILKGGTETVNYQIGVVIERVGELSKNGDNYVVETQDTYKTRYDAEEALVNQKNNVINYLNGTNPDSKYLKDEFSAKALDNKNEMEYSYSLPVNNSNNRQNYVYRAFAYLKDYTIDPNATYTYKDRSIAGTALGPHTGAILRVSDPVYFTIYDMASIKDGETYSGGGQS